MRTHKPSPARLPGIAAAVLACVLAGAGAAAAQVPPPVPLDDLLKAASTYDGGVESAALWQLRDYVHARKDDPAGRAECEAGLLAFLASPAMPEAKVAASRLLHTIAGATAVPALLALLPDDRTADVALYALHGIGGSVAERGLIQALGTTSGATRTAVIAALGERRAAEAIPALSPLLRDPAVGIAAATAVGRIGGDAAAAALLDAYAGELPDRRPALAAALLELADGLLRAKDSHAARRVFDALLADASLPVPERQAAAAGRLAVAGATAPALLMDMLAGPDAASQEAAVRKVTDVFAPEAIGAVCERLPGLPPRALVQLLAVLSTYPSDRVLTSVRDAAGSQDESVRLAALKALATVGDATTVLFLAERASIARGAEQSAARAALGALKGRAADEAIVNLLSGKPADAVAGELLAAVGDRRLFAAKPLVAAALTAPSGAVRTVALRTLRTIGTPSDIPAVIDLLLTADEAERGEAERTIGALARTIGNPDMRGRAVRQRLAGEKAPGARVRLLGVLPLIGDDSTLPLVRAALGDADAGVLDAAARALVAWPTVAARDDVLVLGRTAKSEAHRLLAIAGFVRLVAADPYRRPEAAVADLKTAAALAWRPEEKTLVLGALGAFPCKAALDLATGMLRDPAVKAEALAAIDKITQRLSK